MLLHSAVEKKSTTSILSLSLSLDPQYKMAVIKYIQWNSVRSKMDQQASLVHTNLLLTQIIFDVFRQH